MFRARRLLLRLAARPALPPPPRTRGYAEPAAGPTPMAFTFASPTQVGRGPGPPADPRFA